MNEQVKQLIERAKDVFGCTASQTASKSHLMWVQGEFDFPGFAISGKGCMMKCLNGKEYINFMGNLGAGILDLDDRDVKKALKEQIDRGLIFSLPTTLEVELAELIKSITPNAELMRFCKNGSDACSAAIRLARSYKKKDPILMPKTGYAGWSDQFCAVSARDYGMPKEFKQFVTFFDYNDLKGLEELMKTDKYAAIIMEPVSNEAPKKGYLEGVRALCDQYGVILIFDEMVTGFRYALGGCQELYGVQADLMCYGKAMSNGTSIACIAGKKEYMKELENVFFSATYFGNALDIAGSIATIKKLVANKDKIYPHIWRQGKRFKKAFNSTCKELGIKAHTVGLEPRMNVIFEYEDAVGLRDLFHQEMLERGVFTGIQIYTTWATKKKHMDQIVKATQESLAVVSKALQEGNVDAYLKGQRSMQIFKRQ
jgi:glutamate-1-semialdehyde 2,1-aminomutase